MDSDKYFILTVDTEPDNEWSRPALKDMTFENVYSIPRFHELCCKYQIKPVYLLEYQIAQNRYLQEELSSYLQAGNCEIGLHLHPWSTPPFDHSVKECDTDYHPFLTEYPLEVFVAKMDALTNSVKNIYSVLPKSFRAGRYVLSYEYAIELKKFGIEVDGSVTPFRHWEPKRKAPGSNFTGFDNTPFYWDAEKELFGLPLSAMKTEPGQGAINRVLGKLISKGLHVRIVKKFWSELYFEIKGINWFFRYKKYQNVRQILEMYVNKTNPKFVQGVLHSSELHPGSCFQSKNEVDQYFFAMEETFKYLKEKGYQSIMLKDAPRFLEPAEKERVSNNWTGC